MNRKRLTAMVLSGVLAASMAVTGTAAEGPGNDYFFTLG